MNYGSRLRRARSRIGVSAARIAVLSGTSRSAVSGIEGSTRRVSVDKFDNLLHKTNSQLVIIPTAALTAASAAELVSRDLSAGDVAAAFRVVLSFSNGLRKLDPAVRVAATVEQPALTGTALFDAAIAGVVEEALEDLPTPSWLEEPGYTLEKPELFSDSTINVIPLEDERAAGFFKHNVLFDKASLEVV